MLITLHPSLGGFCVSDRLLLIVFLLPFIRSREIKWAPKFRPNELIVLKMPERTHSAEDVSDILFV